MEFLEIRLRQSCWRIAKLPQSANKKKEQNTADIIAYMDGQKNDVCTVLGLCIKLLKNPDIYAKASPQQIATTMAILIDKYTANNGANIADEQSEDALSKSLRELGEKL